MMPLPVAPHADHPRLIRVIVEQPADEPLRLRYVPEDGAFVRTVERSLIHVRGFPGCYGWIAGTGEPPGPHWDVLLCSADAHPAGAVVAATLCGVFVRADGDHKFVALDLNLAPNDAVADLAQLPGRWLHYLTALYPVVGPGEGWLNAEAAWALVLTAAVARHV